MTKNNCLKFMSISLTISEISFLTNTYRATGPCHYLQEGQFFFHVRALFENGVIGSLQILTCKLLQISYNTLWLAWHLSSEEMEVTYEDEV